MQQQPGAREMAQELMAESGAVRSTLDQTRNIGNHKAAIFVDALHPNWDAAW